jgi:hypothetical protein
VTGAHGAGSGVTRSGSIDNALHSKDSPWRDYRAGRTSSMETRATLGARQRARRQPARHLRRAHGSHQLWSAPRGRPEGHRRTGRVRRRAPHGLGHVPPALRRAGGCNARQHRRRRSADRVSRLLHDRQHPATRSSTRAAGTAASSS